MEAENSYLPEEANAIKELSEKFGIHEPIAQDCMEISEKDFVNHFIQV